MQHICHPHLPTYLPPSPSTHMNLYIPWALESSSHSARYNRSAESSGAQAKSTSFLPHSRAYLPWLPSVPFFYSSSLLQACGLHLSPLTCSHDLWCSPLFLPNYLYVPHSAFPLISLSLCLPLLSTFLYQISLW